MDKAEALSKGYSFHCEVMDYEFARGVCSALESNGLETTIVRDERCGPCRKDPTRYYQVYKRSRYAIG